ncbi:MAG: SDR family oxidoreductase [Ilumatobacter sp.]|nr:SDR family oxidoreductase [Ilumatobacter sp.]
MGAQLIAAGYDVVGLDAGFHRDAWLHPSPDPRPPMITKDVRAIEPADLVGFDAIVHLAEISNDPVGELSEQATHLINHHGTVRLAELARDAGVERFVHMSSCSVYGASGDRASVETDPTEPLTAYARCKVLVERDVGALADESFSPTFLRNATVYGASPRIRFDLVVNDLAAGAYVHREIRMLSDGSPWRPFVHVLDVGSATLAVLQAPAEVVRGEIFNVGSNRGNHQIRQIAEIIGAAVPGCEVQFGPPSADKRNYRADFTKIEEVLGFTCDWDVERGVDELLEVLGSVRLDDERYRSRGFHRLAQIRHLRETGQLDETFRWTAG